MIDRRVVLCAGASLAACAAPRAQTEPPAPAALLRIQLDAISAMTPAARAAALEQYRDSANAEDQILFAATMPGARAEAALAGFPYGAHGALYAVTHRNGAYQRVGAALRDGTSAALSAEIEADTQRIAADAALGVAVSDATRARTLDALSAAEREAIDNTELRAALARQKQALIASAARANNAPGVWALPDGARYAHLNQQIALGAELDLPAVHTRFVRIAVDLQRQAEAILRTQVLTEGDVAARLRTLALDSRHLFADTSEGRNEAVAYMNERLARVRTLLPQAFANLETTPAEVRRMTAEEEARRAAGRRDGSAYVVDLNNIRSRARWTLPSVVYHELLPGHLLQAPLQQAANPHRLQTRYAGGYPEGWAVYAEILADELGAYDDDPVGRLGYLQWLLFRVARVIADIGVHALRWDRARAIAETQALQGESIAFVSIEDDIDRMIVQPGAFAAQGIAAYDILELRESEKRLLGAAFDVKRFHDTILKRGPLSPTGLARALTLSTA